MPCAANCLAGVHLKDVATVQAAMLSCVGVSLMAMAMQEVFFVIFLTAVRRVSLCDFHHHSLVVSQFAGMVSRYGTTRTSHGALPWALSTCANSCRCRTRSSTSRDTTSTRLRVTCATSCHREVWQHPTIAEMSFECFIFTRGRRDDPYLEV